MAVVLVELDAALVGRLPDAGPARSGVVLGVRAEQLRAAPRTPVHAGIVLVPVRAAEGPLGAFLPEHVELLRQEPLSPLLLRPLDSFGHVPSMFDSVLRPGATARVGGVFLMIPGQRRLGPGQLAHVGSG